MNKQPYYIDMDGTIADFNNEADALARFATERGFFTTLKPLAKNVQAVRNAIAHGEEVYILTASPNEQADADKIKWLTKYVPEVMRDHVIIVRLGANKADAMLSESGILFDDYGKNCREWVGAKENNRAVKVKQDGDIFMGMLASKVLKEKYLNA